MCLGSCAHSLHLGTVTVLLFKEKKSKKKNHTVVFCLHSRRKLISQRSKCASIPTVESTTFQQNQNFYKKLSGAWPLTQVIQAKIPFTDLPKPSDLGQQRHHLLYGWWNPRISHKSTREKHKFSKHKSECFNTESSQPTSIFHKDNTPHL